MYESLNEYQLLLVLMGVAILAIPVVVGVLISNLFYKLVEEIGG